MSKATIEYKGITGRNPHTQETIQRGSLLLKNYTTDELYDFGANSGFFAAGSKKEVVVASFE